MKHSATVKTLTVQEASQNLGRWLRRAIGGEQIAVHEGGCAVLLQPQPVPPEPPASEPMTAREALRRLQSLPRLTAAQADAYLHEVRAERLTDGEPGGSKIAGLAAH
jgi:antitoxin (DNA-binding transcriptional repressor) of toxin-antitoxin stability system